jgi:hypothetical protein
MIPTDKILFVLRTVAAVTGVHLREFILRTRNNPQAGLARSLAVAAIAHAFPNWPRKAIAQLFHRDPTAITKALDRHRLRLTDPTETTYTTHWKTILQTLA